MNIKEYINEATSKIFTVHEKESVSSELSDHIICKQEFYEDIGYSEDVSEEKAVEEMGPGDEIADYLGEIHNDLYNPTFDITAFLILALILAVSYIFLRKYIISDSTAIPIAIGYMFAVTGLYFGINAINLKRNRRLPAVLTLIIGIGISVISFLVNSHINICGVVSISNLKDLMINGILPKAGNINFVSVLIFCIAIIVIAVAAFVISFVFIKKYENQENTLKTNKIKKVFSKIFAALCIFSVITGALFICDILVIQTRIREQYIEDSNTVFEIAQNCENKKQVVKYIEEKGYTSHNSGNNEIIIDGKLLDIRLDFSQKDQPDPNNAMTRLVTKFMTGLLKDNYPVTLEKQSDYTIIFDMSEKFNSGNGYKNGFNSLGLAKIKTQPRDLDNLFDFETKDNLSNQKMIDTYLMYYPKKIVINASNNLKTHSSTVNFEYPTGKYEFSYVQTFEQKLLCKNAVKVSQQKNLVLDTLNANPNISNEELAKAVGAKLIKPYLSFSDYKDILKNALDTVDDIEIDEKEIKKAYKCLECFEFSDDLVFCRFAGIKNIFDSKLNENELIDFVLFDSKTDIRYVSFSLYGKTAEARNKKYVSRFGGMFRKTYCEDDSENLICYDINGNAYTSETSVAYYSKDGERFIYYQDEDDEGKLIEQYFIGSKGSKCIANQAFVDSDGYFVCGDDNFVKDYDTKKSSLDPYRDKDGNKYYKACEVSWDENGNLLDFDEYLDLN